MKNLTLFFGILLSSASIGQVQDDVNVLEKQNSLNLKSIEFLKKASEKFLSLKSFSMDIEYKAYFNANSFDKPDESDKGTFIRSKNKLFQKEMGNIKILNDDYQFYLNPERKTIVISERKSKDVSPLGMNLDSLESNLEKVEAVDNGVKYFLKKGKVSAFQISIDSQGFLVDYKTFYRDKIDFGKGEVNVVTELSYSQLNKNPNVSSNLFSTSKYISINTKTNEVIGIGVYKDFYIINQLPRK